MKTLEAGQLAILERARRIVDAARKRAVRRDKRTGGFTIQSRIDEIRLVVGFSEPGYGHHDSIVALGNWNDIQGRNPATGYYDYTLDKTPSELSDALQRIGVHVEWGDEWTQCDHCHRAVRTQPDSYGWTRSYWMDEDDGDVTCKDCTLEDFAEEYVEYLQGNVDRCTTFPIDLEDFGFRLHSEGYETGFHRGQNDDPVQVAAQLGHKRFVFKLDNVGQFDARWSVWVRDEDEDEDESDDNEESDG